jgi:hypothetical protein
VQCGVADIQLLIARKRESETEAAYACDFLHTTLALDAIDLTQFAARPESAIRIESQALGVIEAFGKVAKLLKRDEGAHDLLHAYSFSRQANIVP